MSMIMLIQPERPINLILFPTDRSAQLLLDLQTIVPKNMQPQG